MADAGAPTPLATNLSIAPFDVDLLDADPATICVLDRDHRITHVNRAWREFGRTNGCTWSDDSWTRGISLVDSIPPVLRGFYLDLFARARASNVPVTHSYECSTPSTFRRFYMQAFRCDGGRWWSSTPSPGRRR